MLDFFDTWFEMHEIRGVRDEICRDRVLAPILLRYAKPDWSYPPNTRTKSMTAWRRDQFWREQVLAKRALQEELPLRDKDFVNLCSLAYGTGKILK